MTRNEIKDTNTRTRARTRMHMQTRTCACKHTTMRMHKPPPILSLLRYYTACSGNFFIDVWGQPIGPSGVLNPEDGADRLSQNVGTTTCCVITQWSAVLSYFAVEAWNHACGALLSYFGCWNPCKGQPWWTAFVRIAKVVLSLCLLWRCVNEWKYSATHF